MGVVRGLLEEGGGCEDGVEVGTGAAAAGMGSPVGRSTGPCSGWEVGSDILVCSLYCV